MIKLTGFFLQAILVVIAVLLFSFFDPFGIFGSKKQTLVDTPITVSSIKEIGKFISAEYYGEVLSSLNEIYIEKLDSNKDVLRILDNNFREAITELRSLEKKIKNKNKLTEYFHENYAEVTEHPFYNSYMEYLKKKYNESKEKNVLDKLVDNPKIELNFDENLLNDLRKETRELFSVNKKTLKQQIVLLGRGWVKAGFNFEKFSPANFKYVSSSRCIYLIGMKPEILSCTINPWFIPEKKVKGFELVLYTGKANDPKLMSQVKEDCLLKLRQAALEQNILGKAEENAKQNLKTFFSLLIEGGIDNVYFADDTLDLYKSEILKDNVIKEDELSTLDSLLSKSGTGSFNSLEVKALIDSVKAKTFYFRNNVSTLTCYSSLAYKVTSDWTVDSLELLQLKELKKNIETPYQFEDYWFGEADTLKNDTRKKWFDIALNDIEKNTNQLIESEKSKFVRNDKAKTKSDSTMIASTFKDLRN